MDGATGRALAGHRRPLDGGASVLPVARRRGTASHGSGVGSGRRGPKRDGVPLGQLLGARPRQRGGGNRQLQAGWLVPSRAVGGRRPGPDRQRVGVGCGGDPGVERAGSPRDQGRRLRHAAQECGDPRSQLVPRGSASGLEDRFPVRTAQVTRPPEPVGPRVRISATMKHVWLIAAALFGGCQPQARRLLLLDLALSDPVALNGTARPWKDAGYTVRYRRFYPHLTRADLGQYRTLVFLLGREPEAPSDALTAGDVALLAEWVRGGGVVVLGYDGDAAAPPRARARRYVPFPGGCGALDAPPRGVGAHAAGAPRLSAVV